MCLKENRPAAKDFPVLSFRVAPNDVKDSNRKDKPKPVFVNGFKVDKPTSTKRAGMFFPTTASKAKAADDTKPPISLVIPCYNEEAKALDRTIRSLKEQVLLKDVRLEVVVVMDGYSKITPSMKDYLKDVFLVDVGVFDTISDSIKTLIVEQEEAGSEADDSKISLSLVVKRHNKGKVDSQRWWVGCHALATKCDYVYQTDCGIILDPHCIRLMYERLEMDHNVVGASCLQRTMSAVRQTGVAGEIWREPLRAIFRILQTYDMEDASVPTRMVNNELGHINVMPGCGGLWRYSSMGSMEEGPLQKYFELFTGSSVNDGIVMGNFRLGEDRVLPYLVTFQNEAECNKRQIVRPRLCFLEDAISYCEAEYPLDVLVKQRRRWGNNAVFRTVWLYTHPALILDAVHSPLFKLTAFVFSTIALVQNFLYAFASPPFIAAVVYAVTKLLVAFYTNEEDDMLKIISSTDPSLVLVGMIPTLAYLLLYVAFLYSHAPIAVETINASKRKEWQLDRQSSYVGGMWKAHNIVHFAIHWTVLATLFCYGMLWPTLCAIFKAHASFALVDFCFRFVMYQKLRPTKLIMYLYAAPLAYTGISLVKNAWFASYCLARIPDISWGTRAGSHESGNAGKQAKWSESVGRKICTSLLLVNFALFFLIMQRMHNGADVFLLEKQRFDLLFVINLTDPMAAVPTFGFGRFLKNLFLVWTIAVLLEKIFESTQWPEVSGRKTSGPVFNDRFTKEATNYKVLLLKDILHPFLEHVKSKEKED